MCLELSPSSAPSTSATGLLFANPIPPSHASRPPTSPRVGSPANSAQDDFEQFPAALIDTALLEPGTWPQWFQDARVYLTFDEEPGDTLKDECWNQLMLAWTMLEARDFFHIGASPLSNKNWPATVGQ